MALPNSIKSTDPIYSKLLLPEPKSIRLLTILPSEAGDIIKCQLEVVNLDETPKYTALSYVWGPRNPPTKIICNTQVVEVYPNLGSALRRLSPLKSPPPGRFFNIKKALASIKRRIVHGDSHHTRIWIDALCINQNDLDERSKQVSFMKEIYSKAANVIAWLGEDEGYASDAINLINKVADVAMGEKDYLDYSSPGRPEVRYDPDYTPPDNLSVVNDASWDCLFKFYENQWFHRVWVVQEVAHDNVLMVVGSHKVNYTAVGISSYWLISRPYFVNTAERVVLLSTANLLREVRSGAPLSTMLLYITTRMEATDPRDQIYALLGLDFMWRDRFGIPRISFYPDYKKAVAEVYRNTVRCLLTSPKSPGTRVNNLEIILSAESSLLREDYYKAKQSMLEDENEFSSWTPRWDQCLSYSDVIGINTCAQHWNLCSDLPVTLGEIRDERVLPIRGFEFTEVAFLNREFVFPDPPPGSEDTFVRRTLADCVDRNTKYVGDNELKQALACTLTAGSSKYTSKQAECNHFGREDLDEYLAHGSQTPTGKNFQRSIRVWRTLFITTDRSMGLGSREIQVGDKICVLFGGNTFFILRQAGRAYRLIGACYVYGFMNGEVMEKLKSGEVKEQFFDLQ
ncbi:hypothetical protein MMC19_006224 [Ptychographa xylographoides]|nr:hypothetical protein [Ptychographa xylographoides]